ncbi:F-box only protein 16-like isoform X4 [Xyrauchen texanus]|uniref:F-box only protein 16-like isoform X4 n=1 Tax=Xyrauchen texanus TaxID=154827 RepID=UPI002242C12B|nr:F-box only protein 16-like isoform X4 [Xyrauchen texanus]
MFIPILTLLQMMPQAPSSKMQTTPSTWTPLNHQLSKAQVFEERRNLIGKWVSWHWKNLVELDQLWMPKCLKLGWCITFAPTPFEQGVWKRHYIVTVQALHISRPKVKISAKEEFIIPEVKVIGSGSKGSLPITGKFGLSRQHGKSKDGNGLVKSAKGLPPWRDPDRHPTDTISFNYLNNVDPVKQARNVLLKGRCNSNTTRQENGKKYHPTLHTSCASPNL